MTTHADEFDLWTLLDHDFGDIFDEKDAKFDTFLQLDTQMATVRDAAAALRLIANREWFQAAPKTIKAGLDFELKELERELEKMRDTRDAVFAQMSERFGDNDADDADKRDE